jgi:hypothetical protein
MLSFLATGFKYIYHVVTLLPGSVISVLIIYEFHLSDPRLTLESLYSIFPTLKAINTKDIKMGTKAAIEKNKPDLPEFEIKCEIIYP